MSALRLLPFLKHFWAKGPKPIYLIYEPTLRCNAACSSCYNLDKLNPSSGEMTLEEAERFSRGMDTHLLVLALSGGEPMLRDDLPELVETFSRNTRMEHLSIPTNALLPERIRKHCERILQHFPRWFVLHISLDGIGPLHDEIRRVPGNFESALKTYELTLPLTRKYSNFHLSVNTTLSRKNVHQIREISDFVREHLPAARNHSFSIVRNPPSPDLDFDVPRFLRENRELLRRIVWSQKPYHFDPLACLNLAYNELYYELSREFRTTGKRNFDCYGGSLACYVDAHSNLHPCEMFGPIGNLREHGWDFAGLYRSEAAARARRSVRERRCACDHGCFLQLSTLFNLKMYPRMAKAALRHALFDR